MSKDSQIPIINLSSPNASQQLLHAACDNGFIFIEHGADIDVTPRQVDDMFQYSHDLFAAPQSVKAVCAIDNKAGKNHGWLGPGAETLDPGGQVRPDQKEAFNIGPFSPTHQSRSSQPLPLPLQPHREDLSRFMQSCHALCTRILTLLAAALEMPGEWFAQRHEYENRNSSVLRLLYYPTLDAGKVEKEDVRAGAHSDYGSVTLLFRLPGQPGLEILTQEGEWVDVPVDPVGEARGQVNGVSNGVDGEGDTRLPVLINIGDVLSYWTNGLLKSTVHRVVFPTLGEGDGERYSIAYFCHPDDDARLVEVPSRVVEDSRREGSGVKPIEGVETAKDHLNARLAATYGVK